MLLDVIARLRFARRLREIPGAKKRRGEEASEKGMRNVTQGEGRCGRRTRAIRRGLAIFFDNLIPAIRQ